MWKKAVLFLLLAIVAFVLFGDNLRIPFLSEDPTPSAPPLSPSPSSSPKRPSSPATKKPRSTRASPAQIKRFLEWVFDHGARFNYNITLEPIPGFGLGLMAHEHVPKRSEYLVLPYELLIGRDNILSDPHCKHVFRELQSKFGENIKYEIMLYILFHKHVLGKKSFFWPFLDILPPSFDVPIFYSDSKLRYLEGSDLHTRVLQQRETYRRQYESLKQRVFQAYPTYFPPSKIPFEEFLWVQWIYSSRLFFIEQRQPREHLLPLADMVNCFEPSPRESDLVFVEDSGSYLRLIADRNFYAGEQVFESYGYKSNAESFQYEGFILDNTPNDCVWFFMPFNDQIREKFGYRSAPEWCFSASDLSVGKFPGNSMEYLRFFVAESKREKEASGYRSKENEMKMTKLLLGVVNKKLKANPYDEATKSKILAVRFMSFEKLQLRRIREVLLKRLERWN